MDNYPIRPAFGDDESYPPFGSYRLPVPRAGEGIEPCDDDRVVVDQQGF